MQVTFQYKSLFIQNILIFKLNELCCALTDLITALPYDCALTHLIKASPYDCALTHLIKALPYDCALTHLIKALPYDCFCMYDTYIETVFLLT